MRQIVADVGEPRGAGPDPAGGLDRLGHGEVRGMRVIAQRVEHQHPDALEQRPRLVGNPAAVGQVRERPEPVAENEPRAVLDGHGHDELVPQAERAGDGERAQARHAAAARGALAEDVAEGPAKIGEGGRVAETGDGLALQHVEPPHLVEAEDVVGVAVREQDRVDAGEPEAQRLRAQVGRRVHEHLEPVVELDEDRRAPAPVARVVGPARGALAADHRHAV